MRNLELTCAKSSASLGLTSAVYVEDPAATDFYLNDVPCRKLGTLKNGETATFPVEDFALHIFVCPNNTMSGSHGLEPYTLPVGFEGDTVRVSGRYHSNINSVQFRFDGVTDEAVLAARKKNTKRGILITVAAVLVGLAVSVIAILPDWVKTFTPVEGMSIDLTFSFEEMEYEGYNFAYTDDYVIVSGFLDDAFTSEELAATSLEEYLPLFTAANEWMAGVSVKDKDGIPYYQYSEAIEGEVYVYTGFFYKCADGFWVVEFCTFEENMDPDICGDDIFRWAKSVTFTE